MKVSTIATGDELLLGVGRDTNFNFLTGRLSDLGLTLITHQIVSDDVDLLQHAFRYAMERSDCLIVTGGLGPTTDDLTREAMAYALGRTLYVNRRILENLKRYYQKRSGHSPESLNQQAMFIKGARSIPNQHGTAEGMLIDGDKKIFLLPGPPHEMIPMFDRYVLPKLRQWQGKKIFEQTVMRTFGLSESAVQEKIQSLPIPDGILKIGYRSSWEGVDIRFKLRKKVALIERYLTQIRKMFKDSIYAENEMDMLGVVLERLKKSKLKISVAESCTGGLFSESFTAIPGASSVFAGSVVAYSNSMKEILLGVRPLELKRYGAVSATICASMAGQIRSISGSDIGLAITGIAGPGGSTRLKPVGTVFLALDTPEYQWCEKFQFRGDRIVIQHRAVQTLLNTLRRYLLGLSLPSPG
ncbi:MAG: CinA family nicotinamide mononucleotide deamidase-related protein [Chlamydiota bacterium]|nr:CinA family nicotinamide mononucleotide deamidase-related protein [Chlamydiota bacterium]